MDTKVKIGENFDYNSIVFLVRNVQTKLVYISEFHGNSTKQVDKYRAKELIQPCYSLLKMLSRSQSIGYRQFGVDQGGKSAGCCRFRIYSGERYQKNIVKDVCQVEEDEVKIDETSNENDYFDPKWTKKLQQFAVEKKQKSIFYKSQQKRGFKLSKSKIHGRGLFATRKFSPDEEIIEYVGEIIRPIIADLREDWYRKNGQGNYMFSLNEERVIDASQLSSMARFINHCCDPNCVVTNYDDERLVISAVREIQEDEELSFDYGYGHEIECNCGARKCSRFRVIEEVENS
jgi:hypothetical protein